MAKKQSKSATKATETNPATSKEILAKAQKAPAKKPVAKPQAKAATTKKTVANGKSKPTNSEESSESSSEGEGPKSMLVKVRQKTVSSSSSSESSDDEAQSAPKISTVKPSAKRSLAAPTPAKNEVDDSDSSEVVPAKSVPSKSSNAVQKKSAPKKREDASKSKKTAAASSKNMPVPPKIAPPAKKVTPLESSESSDSDSDDATHPSKPNAVKETPSSEDSSDSDSDESDAPAAKRVNGTAAKTAESSDSSEESDSPKAPKTALARAKKAKSSDSSDGSDESDSSDDVDDKPVASAAKKAALADSSDDSSSSEDEDGDVKMAGVPAKSKTEAKPATIAGTKRKAEDDVNLQAKKAKLPGGTAVHTDSDQQTTTIFVGRLSWSVDNDRLAQEFAECGEVESATVQMDRDTGKSRGFGYVRFKTADAVEKALVMNGKEIDGRAVNIDRGNPPDRNKGREQRAKAFDDQISPPSSVLFVGNISFATTEDGLWEYFNDYGVKSVRLPTDRETGRPKGYGYVEFEGIEGAKKAFEASQGAEIEGRAIRLDYSQPRDGPGGGGRGGGRGFGRGGGRGGFDRGGRGGRGGFDRGGRGRGGFDRGGRGGYDRGGRGGYDGGRGGRGGARRGMPAPEGKKITF